MKNYYLETGSSSWGKNAKLSQLSRVLVASLTSFPDPLFPNLKMEELGLEE